MHYNISFPNLGIYLDHVGKKHQHLWLFNCLLRHDYRCSNFDWIFDCHSGSKKNRTESGRLSGYGNCRSNCRNCRRKNLLCNFSWIYNKDNLLSIFNLREGGLAIYGGVIGAVIAVFVMTAVKKKSAFQILDTIALALLNGQMLGRWGNFFNREAFGEYTDCLFAMRLPVDAVRPGDITELMRENMQRIDGVSYIQVHPTFLYESLWCAGLLIILFLYRKHKKYEGELFLMYLFGYGAGRVWIERLRTDQLVLPGIGFPVSELLAGCLVIVTGIMLIYCRRHCRKRNEKKKVDQYEPVPTKIKGKKPPKWDDRLFKNR